MKEFKGNRLKRNKKKYKKFNKSLLIIPIILIVIIIITIYLFNKKSNSLEKFSKKYIKDNKIEKNVGKVNSLYKYNLGKSYYINYPSFSNRNLDKQVSDEKKYIINMLEKKSFGQLLKELTTKSFVYNIIDYESYLGPDGIIGVAFIETKLDCTSHVKYKKVYNLNMNPNENKKLNNTYIFVEGYKNKITEYVDKYLNSDDKFKSKLKSNYKKIINKDNEYKYVISSDGVIVYFDSNEIIKSNDIIKITIPFNDIDNYLNIDYNVTYKNINDIKNTKEKFKDNKKKMYIKRLSNLYKDSSKNSDLVTIIEKGNKVSVEKSSENYSLIKYGKNKGYILNKYLSDEIVADANFIDTNETVYASEDISIKKGVKDDSEELVKLALGDSITRIGTSDDGWSEVVYNNEKGYVKSNYLSLIKPVPGRLINIDKNKNINAKGGMVALTFDDGPNPSSSNRILDTLEKYHVVATFFDLGKLALTYPDVVKREESLGCEVGTHSYDHPNLNNLNTDAIQKQITNSKNAFVSVLGHDVQLMRPPYGNANDLVKSIVPYPLINWNVDTLDWKTKNKDAIVNEVRKIENLDGKIILMHSIYETTADAVEVIVPELINEGYQLVTVSELAYYKGAELSKGVKYFGF